MSKCQIFFICIVRFDGVYYSRRKNGNRRFRPVRQSRVSEDVTAQLKQSILVGQFKPGDKLPAERELVEEFDVSRAAIREGLRVLENTGFIATRQGAGGGAFVTDLSFRLSDQRVS